MSSSLRMLMTAAAASGFRTTQPSTASSINTANPLAAGVKFFAHGGGAMRDVVRGITPSGFVSTSYAGGIAHNHTSSSTVLTYDNSKTLAIVRNVPFWVGIWMASAAPSNSYAGMVGRWDNLTWEGWSFGVLGSAGLGFSAYQRGGDKGVGSIAAYNNTDPVCFMAVSDGTTVRIYANGTQRGSFGVSDWTDAGGDTFRIGVLRSGDMSEIYPGKYGAVGMATGSGIAQSAADIQSLSNNPWQLVN